nr:hypothetical protein GCM10025732_39110 [Glycomyces mayteni]
MAEELVVGGGEGVEEVGVAGGVLAEGVAEGHVLEGLVEGDPVAHAVAEAVGDGRGVGGEAVGGVAVEPAAAVFEGLREVPVEEGGHGGDAGVEEGVHEAVVEREAGFVDRSGPVGLDAGPGDGEAVGVGAEAAQEGDVLFVPVVVVAGGGGGVAVADLAGRRGERVPHGGAAPVLVHGPFDLERRGGGPPDESLGQARYGGHGHLRT